MLSPSQQQLDHSEDFGILTSPGFTSSHSFLAISCFIPVTKPPGLSPRWPLCTQEVAAVCISLQHHLQPVPGMNRDTSYLTCSPEHGTGNKPHLQGHKGGARSREQGELCGIKHQEWM